MEVDEQPASEQKDIESTAADAKSKKAALTAFQIRDRKAKTVFVGNVPVPASAKQLQKIFRACGKIEKIWFRSICISDESKRPQRAKIIQKELGTSKDSKNAYILFQLVNDAQGAKAKLNQVLFQGKHLRVDTLGQGLDEQEGEFKIISKSGRNTCVNPWEDFTRTIFIGNLPFVVSEEEIRSQFTDCGKIENVRLIRDPKTHLGKGIGYIMFSNKEEMKAALDKARPGMRFKQRDLRIARAVEPKRREKKKNRQAAALEERRERRRERLEGNDSGEESEPLPPKNFGDAYSSEDSDDDKMKKRKADREVRLENTNFGKKPDSKAERDAHTELTLNNLHGIARKKKQTLL